MARGEHSPASREGAAGRRPADAYTCPRKWRGGRLPPDRDFGRSSGKLMFAIAFDLAVADTLQRHPKSVPQAFADIGSTLAEFGFERVQGYHATQGAVLVPRVGA